jgi:SOS response regulatory protein OraA/RecX
MFESAKAIREAQKARMVKRAREKEQERIKKELQRRGVTLSPEVINAVFGNRSEDDS